MDPNETLKQLLEDISWEDWSEAQIKYAELKEWLEKGGFEPAWMTVISEFIHE